MSLARHFEHAPAAKKKLYVKTYGCQMNVYDSACMERLMGHIGYESCDAPDDADMTILNTCHIREKAAEKMYSELGRINVIKSARKAQGKNMTVVVAGCVGQAEGEEIFARAPYVDAVVGPQSYHHLPDMILGIERTAGRAINLDFDDAKFDKLPEETCLPEPGVAYVSIQEGCDKFCSFCVVPYTRGAEYSRPLDAVMRETMRGLALGAREIVLLGQNVNAYHGAQPDKDAPCNLGELIRHISALSGVERIRYSTSHPRDMHQALYDAHGNVPALIPFVSLPVQSGADAVLEAMNRKHDRNFYFSIVDKLRAKRPDAQFGSDFIVGFPGETDADFNDTMDLVQRVGFIQGYSFKYSPRPGTPGAERSDQISEEVKDARLQALQSLIMAQQQAFAQSCVGKTMHVLLSKKGRKDGQLLGRTEFMQSAHVDNAPDAWLGKVVPVEIIEACPNSLRAKAA
ncbi:MAG: tRNA (N6-isopentenyl adenosine(37)-C2)-methylthiotransferase MiaB [Rickettsiales bacterium]